MRTLCLGMMLFCAIVGVGVLEDCQGDCIPEDANAAWRWMVAIVAVLGTAFFGFAGAIIKR